jgi:hypothetical protein
MLNTNLGSENLYEYGKKGGKRIAEFGAAESWRHVEALPFPAGRGWGIGERKS